MAVTGSRQRVLDAIAGRRTDRVPVYFEFGPVGDRLRQAGVADPEAHFGVDVRKIWFQPRVDPPPAPPPGGPHVGDADQLASYRLWGYAPRCIDRRNPLIDCRRAEDISRHPFPTLDAPGETERLEEIIRRHRAAGYAVAGQIPYLGGVVFETAYRLRGLDNLLEDFRARPDFAQALLDRVSDNAARNVAILAGAGADIVFLGDDIGTPASMLISPALWRRWIKPCLARVIAAARAVVPDIPIAYHSDGWCRPVLDDLVEVGVGIINPVQPDCMDPLEIRRRYGPALALWGTVGSAALMSFGTPRQVHDEVRLRLEQLDGSGLILCPAYDIQDDVPLANVEAFFAACSW